jgi:hypothetical protein
MNVSCFHCGKEVRVKRSQCGEDVRCPHCGQVFPVPSAAKGDEAYLEEPRRRGEFLVPTLVSCLFHGGLLFVCAMVTWSYQSPGSLGDEVLIGNLPSVELRKSGAGELQTADVDPDVEKTPELVDSLEDVAPPSPAEEQEASEIPAFPVAAGGSLSKLPDVQMVGGGGSGGGSFRIFGHRGVAKWLCVVADRSGSMEGEKLEYVKREILETLTRLKPTQRFQLVFYNHEALPYPKSGWLRPDEEQEALRRWLDKVDASGQTEPTTAFEAAFRLRPRPDVIVFLTDGLFEEHVVDDVARLNAQGEKRTKIYTVSFIDQSAEPMLREIAKESGGKYRHVSGF